MKKKKTALIVGLVILFAAILLIAAGILYIRLFPKEMRQDFNRFTSESHDTVFLSMYPVDNYEEEIYMHWRAMDAIVTSHEIPDLFTLENYLKKLDNIGTCTTVYLGVMPEKLEAPKLAALLTEYPQVRFEVIMPYPRLDYWLSLTEDECTELLNTYRAFIPPMLDLANASPYFFGGAEWLIANPANYEDTLLTIPQISETLMLHSDRDHSYVITSGTQPYSTAPVDVLADLIAAYRQTPPIYSDLSDRNIVFFGDSVICNYKDTRGIPGVVSGLTGANVYNLGYGGGCATEYDVQNGEYSLRDILTMFLEKDSSGLVEEVPFYGELNRFIAEDPSGDFCFVINYGLNDYFNGLEIASTDPYDLETFTGAVRSAVQSLKEAYPDSDIVLNTPNFVSIFNFGTDTPSAQGYVLADYAEALKEVAAEMQISLLDNFGELPFNEETHGFYLADGCHPNEAGRFLIGKRIATLLGD